MKLLIEKLVKKYDNKIILDHMDASINQIQVLAIIGPSGSGKSTLLRLIAGLESYESGAITMNDKTISQDKIESYRKQVGFVFQDHNLFSHLSIYENIALILEKVHGRNREDFHEEVEKLLTHFGLMEHEYKLPHQISGGQSQRASIARALAIKPEIILLDEPTSSLDPILTYDVLHAIKQLVEEEKDVILVTHEIGFAKNIADYVLYLEEGKVVEHGERILHEPQTENLKRFLDKILNYK